MSTRYPVSVSISPHETNPSLNVILLPRVADHPVARGASMTANDGFFVLVLAMTIACSSKESLTDTSGETDTGKPTDSDTDADGGAISGACLGSISGTILENGETGMLGGVAVCIGALCLKPAESDAEGRFVWYHPAIKEGERCGVHDFDAQPLHIEVLAGTDSAKYAEYAFILHPTAADISDKGEDDFDLDLGNLSLFRLPDSGEVYDPETGVVVDRDGLRFEVPPEGIVKRVVDEDVPIDHTQEIVVFRAPLDVWSPPFASDLSLDALYFVTPEWAKLAGEGVSFSVALPSGGSETDTGTLFLLGGYTSKYGDTAVRDRSAFIYRDATGNCINTDDDESLEMVADGVFGDCGVVSVEEGRIVTPPIPRFTWVGIGR